MYTKYFEYPRREFILSHEDETFFKEESLSKFSFSLCFDFSSIFMFSWTALFKFKAVAPSVAWMAAWLAVWLFAGELVKFFEKPLF